MKTNVLYSAKGHFMTFYGASIQHSSQHPWDRDFYQTSLFLMVLTLIYNGISHYARCSISTMRPGRLNPPQVSKCYCVHL